MMDRIVGGLLLAFVTMTSGAHAAGPSTADQRALAEALFQAGRELIEAGRVSEACAKFAESQRVAPAGGTLLNLAICHETEGRLATALVEYQEAIAVSRKAGRKDRIEIAQQYMRALLPRVPVLRIVVPPTSTRTGLTIHRGAMVVGPDAWGLDIPIDPGAHVILAEAPGCTPWTTSREIKEGQRVQIEVPALRVVMGRAQEGAPKAVGAPGPAEVDRGNDWRRPARTSAWVAGAIGIGLLGAGSYYGIRALEKRHESDDLCRDGCSREGVAVNVEAQRAATRSNLLLEGGVVLTGLSAFILLWTSAPVTQRESSNAAEGVRFDAGASRGAMGVFASGGF